jgi:hypothetical protein
METSIYEGVYHNYGARYIYGGSTTCVESLPKVTITYKKKRIFAVRQKKKDAV